MPPKAKEKIENEIRALARLDGNKICVDCPERMPTYINMTHKTFVCTKCAVIHREFQFKVKGISMTAFTAEDVAEIKTGGNVALNAKYLARASGRDFALPSGNDVTKLRDFLRMKYVDKRWYSEDGSPGEEPQVPAAAQRRGTVAVVASTKSAFPSGGVESNRRGSTGAAPSSTAGSYGLDLLSMQDEPISAPAPAKSASSSFDAFGAPVPAHSSHAATFDAFGNTSNTGGGAGGGFNAFDSASTQPTSFDAFDSGSFHQHHAPPQPSPAANTFDAFGDQHSSASLSATSGFGAPQPAFNAFGAPSHQPQGGFGGGFPGAAPTAPMPFIKVTPPAPAPTPAPVVAPAPAPTPVVPGFSAFDDIAPAPINQQSANPFDVPASGAQAGNLQAHPAGHPGYGYPPQPNPYPYNPYAPAGVAPPNYGGYPPQSGYPPQQSYPQPGYGHQPQYGAPPPSGYPQHAPAGYPQHPSAGYNQPVAGYGQPAHAQATHNPFGGPGVGPAGVAPPQAPVEAAAPDPFSSMGGLAWGSVGKTPPPATSSSSSYAPAPAPAAASDNPFDMF